MPSKRQLRLIASVANAARRARPVRPRGKPTPENLTASGRELGLVKMRAAPRCQAKRRDGQPCRAAALRGATRCIKHGGRVEVPYHPHNIRRFLSGEMHRAMQRHDDFQDAKASWDKLTWKEQMQLVERFPSEVADNPMMLYAAAWLEQMRDERRIGIMTFQRRWQALLEGSIWWAQSA